MQNLLTQNPVIKLVFLCVFLSQICHAQKSDLQLLLEHDSYTQQKHKVHYLFQGKTAFVKYNPVSLSFGSMLYVYQKWISPQFMSECLYNPSCSHFSYDAIQEFGLIKGLALSADRLTRCNKLSSYDLQPVHFDFVSGKIKEDIEMFHVK